ncbi:MAG: M15 family metallopeptidase [Verrucomicrobia bacterium]|nr:M15 family metallopeptidase [Verrucomicrobiota bacterium]
MNTRIYSFFSIIFFIVLCLPLLGVATADDIRLKCYLLGQFEPHGDKLFVAVPTAYSAKTEVQYLRKEAMDAFKKMADAAKTDGITLKIVSATRTFFAQKTIWEAKWKNMTSALSSSDRAKTILQYSAMPGTSRHHWGTDVDINSVEPDYFTNNQGKQEYEWLVNNANRFGFRQPYTAKNGHRPTGYEEEKWHWSYIPLALEFLHKYSSVVTYSDITGFEGSETAKQLKVIEQYVYGIHFSCT